ncbi:MAG: HAD family hydrolase [Candidatus Brocadiae bacterium]|nr:HAD family hydrolase [Candidatus Brocadiia bacterium]
MKTLQDKKAILCDMDGVLYHGNRLLPGAKEFIEWIKKEKKKILFLTNSSDRTPVELQQKLRRLGIEVEPKNFYTSAIATAQFLKKQCPQGSVYIIGGAGLVHALYEAGFSVNDVNPNYVVIGETKDYDFDKVEKAINLVLAGAKLIGTNPDTKDRIGNGFTPGTGALIAPIEKVTGCQAYFLGKPNPFTMSQAMKKLNAKKEDTIIIGDRMDTDIIGGMETGIETVLLLSGVTTQSTLKQFAYHPDYIFQGLIDFVKFCTQEGETPNVFQYNRFSFIPLSG